VALETDSGLITELINFMHPYLAFITLSVVLAAFGYWLGVENDLERMIRKAKEHQVYVFDKKLGQWRFVTIQEVLESQTSAKLEKVIEKLREKEGNQDP